MQLDPSLSLQTSLSAIDDLSNANKYIEEIYGLVEKTLNNGQEKINVDVFPFKMTAANMKRHKKSEYYSFWEELKPGYDYFEKNKIPPRMTVENKKYKLMH